MKLNKNQQRAVETDKNKVIVVAAAGSGKTRVITERLKYLLSDQGVDAASIVAITFTNLAAEEMRERLVGVPNINESFIGTIHSFANRIMRDSGERYQLYTKELNLKYHQYLIALYCKHLSIEKYNTYMSIVDDIEKCKAPEDALVGFLTEDEKAELRILHRSAEQVDKDNKEYKKGNTNRLPPDSIDTLCRKNYVITFDELIQKATEYFKSINASIEYLLVDEFQDIGTLEYRFFEGLNANHTFYVGDDYQAIYGFKGGNVEIFKKLIHDPKYTTYYLTENYRNASEILDLADTVIKQVPDRINKDVVGVSKDTGSISFRNPKDIEMFLKSIPTSEYGKYFFLTRSNKDLYDVAVKTCDRLKIPYILFKREGLNLKDLRSQMDSNAIKIMTVHVSKGLESDNVIMYGRFPRYKPSWMQDVEERRVMYVGVTRARYNLTIFSK